MSTLASAHAHDLDRSLEGTPQPRRSIALGPLLIDVDAYRVHVNGKEVPLTWLEFKLLVALAERPDRVQPRGQLLAEVWRVKPGNTTRTVDTHVKRLRDKLGPAGGMIQTVRGVGYRLSELPSVQDVDGRCSGRGAVGRTREGSVAPLVDDAPRRRGSISRLGGGGSSLDAPPMSLIVDA